MKIRVINTNPVDVLIDITGNNNPTEKIILHPKASEILTVSLEVCDSIKRITGVVVQTLRGE